MNQDRPLVAPCSDSKHSKLKIPSVFLGKKVSFPPPPQNLEKADKTLTTKVTLPVAGGFYTCSN